MYVIITASVLRPLFCFLSLIGRRRPAVRVLQSIAKWLNLKIARVHSADGIRSAASGANATELYRVRIAECTA